MEQIAIIYPGRPEIAENVRRLATPDGFERVDITIPARGNRAAAYQRAMASSSARYKVYIDEGIRVLDRDILGRIIGAFQKHPGISLLGLSGTPQLSTSGLCISSAKHVGGLQRPDGQELFPVSAPPRVEEVEALDSWFLATQRDVPWRSDLLRGTSFLGASACCEHRRAGGRTAVLVLPETACRLRTADLSMEQADQNAFLDEYSLELYPLVTICILTYQRPDYFREALESVLHQTYRNLDIFVTDDSADDRTERLIQPYLADGRITYEHHPEFTRDDNWNRIRSYDNPAAEYVGWLMDDDRFLPEKISTMVDAYRTHPEVSLVTSYRYLIDGDGNRYPDDQQATVLTKEDRIIPGQEVGHIILGRVVNIIGEPSTVLLKKSFIENHRYEWIDIKSDYDFVDVPMWLNFLQKGSLYYLAKPLSEFRLHGNNEQRNPAMLAGMGICWAQLIEHAWQTRQYLQTEQDLASALRELVDKFLAGCLMDWFPSLKEETRRDFEAAMGRALLTLSKLPEAQAAE